MEFLLKLAEKILWPASAPANRHLERLQHLARYPFSLLRDLASGELNLRAMSLVYTTMLAIVPMLFFVFAVAQVFGVHEQLEPWIFSVLEPLGPRAEEITDSITAFFDNISGGFLAALSVGLLLLTVVSMAQKVEGSFNYVWRVDRPRGFVRRFGEYLSVIIIGPLVMALAMGLIASLSSTALADRLQESASFAAWIGGLGKLGPYVLVISAFTGLYLLIPNTRVRFRPALIGGIAGGAVWTAGGLLFASMVSLSTRLDAIYSGFATVIILMLWLYLSWLILLLGLQLAFYVQNPFHMRYGHRTEPIDNAARERLSLSIMLLIARDFASPRHGWTNESLASALRVPRYLIEPTVNALKSRGLIDKTSGERLIPARDTRNIRLAEIISAIRGDPHSELVPPDEIHRPVETIADRIDTAIATELGDRSLAELLGETDS
ncbi:MAG: YhjD/YihY/BrkB family envelope integrity protein [Gammaproteobacteria bacterium]|jgi:membrane protein